MDAASLFYCRQAPIVTAPNSNTLVENELSNPTLDKIEQQLQLMNTILAEANDIAMLSAFSSMPADLENDSRQALRRLRDKMMERAITRADTG